MNNVNEVWNVLSIPSKEVANDKGKMKTVDVAGGKAQPVSDFLDDVKSSDYKMIKKTIMNKLGKKRTVWIKKFIGNTTASDTSYG